MVSKDARLMRYSGEHPCAKHHELKGMLLCDASNFVHYIICFRGKCKKKLIIFQNIVKKALKNIEEHDKVRNQKFKIL